MRPADVRAAERQAKAIELRAAGLPLAQIAVQCGYRAKQGAHEAIKAGLAAMLDESVTELRRLDSIRLDRLWRIAFARARRGNLDAIDSCVRILARRAALHGLDAPMTAKVETTVSGSLTGVLVTTAPLTEDAWEKAATEHAADLAEREAKAAGTKH